MNGVDLDFIWQLESRSGELQYAVDLEERECE